jgi:ABC-type transporter Mla subunit MlaD
MNDDVLECSVCHYVIGHAKDCGDRAERLLLEARAERDALQATLDQVRTMAEDYAKYVREILKVLDA